mgnify:CR=1 FL=1
MMIGIDDLINAIKTGSDIEFKYNGKSYTILPWTDQGIVIGPQNSDNDSVYKTAEELVNNHKIEGKTIKDIIDQIEIVLM